MNFMRIVSMALVCGSTPALAGASVVHFFDWPFREILGELDTVEDQGFTALQISPPSLSYANSDWRYRYQPVDYRVIAGPLGDEQDLKDLIDAAHERGFQIFRNRWFPL